VPQGGNAASQIPSASPPTTTPNHASPSLLHTSPSASSTSYLASSAIEPSSTGMTFGAAIIQTRGGATARASESSAAGSAAASSALGVADKKVQQPMISSTAIFPSAEQSSVYSILGLTSSQAEQAAASLVAGVASSSSGQILYQSTNIQSSAIPSVVPSLSNSLGAGPASQAPASLASTLSVVSSLSNPSQPASSQVIAGSSGVIPSSSSPSKSSSTAAINYPNAQAGNVAMAVGFNQIFKNLNTLSSCNDQDGNQATACVSGELARCEVSGTYSILSCAQGQSCYALPKSQGQTGVYIRCENPTVAAQALAAGGSSGASSAPSAGNSNVQSTQPASSSASGPSAQPEIVSQSAQSPQLASTPLGIASQSAQPSAPVVAVAQQENANALTTSSAVFASFSSQPTPSAASAQTSTAASVQSGQPGNQHDAIQSKGASSSAPSASASPSPSNGNQLVVNFPDALPSPTASQAKSQAQPLQSLGAVQGGLVAAQKDTLPITVSSSLAASSAVATPSPLIPPPGAAADTVPSGTLLPQASSAASAHDAGITIQPIGTPSSQGGGPFTVTVTVTTTAHDRR